MYSVKSHGFGFREAGVVLDDDLVGFFQILLSAVSIFSLSIMRSEVKTDIQDADVDENHVPPSSLYSHSSFALD